MCMLRCQPSRSSRCSRSSYRSSSRHSSSNSITTIRCAAQMLWSHRLHRPVFVHRLRICTRHSSTATYLQASSSHLWKSGTAIGTSQLSFESRFHSWVYRCSILKAGLIVRRKTWRRLIILEIGWRSLIMGLILTMILARVLWRECLLLVVV